MYTWQLVLTKQPDVIEEVTSVEETTKAGNDSSSDETPSTDTITYIIFDTTDFPEDSKNDLTT